MIQMNKWLKSGAPWIWLNAAAVSACILLVGGLLMLIAVRGSAHFWPIKIREIILVDDFGQQLRLIGQIRDVETVAIDRLGPLADYPGGENGLVTRLLLKTGNRDQTGQDFRWVDQERVIQNTAPYSLALLERKEWGVFFAYVVGLKSEGVLKDSSDIWVDFKSMLDRNAHLQYEIDQLQEGEIGQINYRLEQLRLMERGLQIDRPDDTRAVQEINQERERLLHDYALLETQLLSLQQAIRASSVVVRTVTNGETDHELPLHTIIDAWQPNKMALPEQLYHFMGNLWSFIRDDPREANTEGGIFPAIFGTVLMVLLMTVFVTPLGVIAGLYLKEYARQGFLTRTIRIAVNNLAGVPSIVYGVFGLGFFVYTLGGSIDQLFFRDALPSPTFGTGGLFWASLTLALLTLPIVIVSTEEGLARIPGSIREGSLALGATQWETLWRTIIPMASPGIMTGLILAVARAAGEVAPLMLVGVVKLAPELPLDGNFPFLHLERKFMHLGFHIYDVGFQSPNVEAARPLVYATALLLVLVILLLNISAIHIRNRLREKYRGLES